MRLDPVERSHLVLLGAQCARLALFVAATAYVGRTLGAADFAFVALVSTAFVVVQGVLDMGTSTVTVVRVSHSRESERSVLAALLGWRRAVSLALAAVFATAAAASGGVQGAALAAVAVACLVLPYGAYAVTYSVRQAFAAPMAIAVTVQAAFFAGCVALVHAGLGGASIAALVAAREAVNAWATRQLGAPLAGGPVRAAFFGTPMRTLLAAALPFGVAALACRLAYNASTFFLWFEGPEALAPYAAAERLLSPLQDLAWLFAMPFAATLGAAAARSHGALRREMAARLRFMAGLGALGAALGFALAPAVIELVYAGRYGTGSGTPIEAFRWLSLGMGFAAATPVLAMAEVACHRERELLAIGGAVLAASLVLNAWWVPRFGAEGAAAAAAASSALVPAALAVRALGRADLAWGWDALPYFAPAALALAALPWMGDLPWIQLLTGAALALAAPLVLRLLPEQRAARGDVHAA